MCAIIRNEVVRFEKGVNYLKQIALTMADIEKMTVDSKTKANCRRIITAATQLGLHLVVLEGQDYTEMSLGWQDEKCPPGVYKAGPSLRHYQDPLLLAANILELVATVREHNNSADSGFDDVAEVRVSTIERRLDALECYYKNGNMDRTKLVQEQRIETSKIVDELNPRAQAIKGEIYYHLDRPSIVHYHRWVSLLKKTIPAEFKPFIKNKRLDFLIPQDKDMLYKIIQHDEEVFPKAVERLQQAQSKD